MELIYSIGAELKELLALARLKNFLFCMQIIYTVQRAAWPYKKVGGAQGEGLRADIVTAGTNLRTKLCHWRATEYYKLALAFRSRLL